MTWSTLRKNTWLILCPFVFSHVPSVGNLYKWNLHETPTPRIAGKWYTTPHRSSTPDFPTGIFPTNPLVQLAGSNVSQKTFGHVGNPCRPCRLMCDSREKWRFRWRNYGRINAWTIFFRKNLFIVYGWYKIMDLLTILDYFPNGNLLLTWGIHGFFLLRFLSKSKMVGIWLVCGKRIFVYSIIIYI